MRRAANPWDRFYKDHAAPWRGERDLAPLRPFIDGRILELGCGNGKLLRPLRAAGLDAIGLDVSWHAVRSVGGLLADAATLPFQAESMGTVMDIHCTGHLQPDARRAATNEALRVLRPGGHIIRRRLGAGDVRAGKGEEPAENPGARRLQDGRETHFITQSELEAELQSAGFEVVAATTTHHHPRFGANRVTRENVQVIGRKPQE